MKVTPANLDPDALPHGLKDVQFRATRWGIVVQKRPGRRTEPWSKLQRQYQQRFAFAARMASNPTPLEMQTAMEMAKGTEQTWKDVLTMAALGRYYEIVNPDGTTWGHVEGPVVPAEPEPEPPTPPDPSQEAWTHMQWSHWDDAYAGTLSTSSYAFKGGRFTPRIPRTITAAGAMITAVAGGTYQLAIGTADAGGIIQSLTLSDQVTPVAGGEQVIPFTINAALATDTEHFWIAGRTDAGDTHALPVHFSNPARWLWPCTPGRACLLAKATPSIADTLTLTTSFANPPIGFAF